MDSILVALASLLAGFVDSVVGGGGLILLPALFATYPGAVPGDLLGTNKSAAIWGTGVATAQYARRVQIRWPTMLPAAATCFVAAFLGAWVVTLVSAEILRKLLPIILIALLGYTLARKAAEITVADIIVSVDEPIDSTQCGGNENCMGGGKCMTHDLWTALNQRMVEFLDSVTLQKLVDEQLAKGLRVELLEDGSRVTLAGDSAVNLRFDRQRRELESVSRRSRRRGMRWFRR